MAPINLVAIYYWSKPTKSMKKYHWMTTGNLSGKVNVQLIAMSDLGYIKENHKHFYATKQR